KAGLKVVARWRPEDIWAGVSDLEVYPYLATYGIPLYVNHDIHLKLYVFESTAAFSTSGNLTLRGFGYGDQGDIEVGSFVQLSREDWSKIYEIINSSRQVDDDIYQRYKEYIASCPRIPDLPPPTSNLLGAPKSYTIASLPAVETPAKLAEYYF